MFGLDNLKSWLYKRFQNNINIKNSELTNSSFVQISGDINNYTTINNYNIPSDLKLFNKLLVSKLEKCNSLLLHMKFKNLEQELNTIFSYGIETLSDSNHKEKICFFRCCQSLRENDIENYQIALDYLYGKYRTEILWLKDFWDNTFEISTEDFNKHLPEIQVLIIDRLFSLGKYNSIANIYDGCKKDRNKLLVPELVYNQVCYYYSLSMFNLGKYDEANVVLQNLKSSLKEDKVAFFSIIVQTQIANINIIDERNEKELLEAKSNLEKIKKEYADLANKYEEVVSHLEIQTYFNLGFLNSNYLEKIEDVYESFSKQLKFKDSIKFNYGRCLELKEKIEEAIVNYLTCDWKHDSNISIRLFLCYLRQKKYEEILLKYDDLEDTSITLEHKGIYLLANYYKGDTAYVEKLKETLKSANRSFSDLFQVAFYVVDKKIFEDIVMKTIDEMLDLGISFYGISNIVLVGYVYMFLHYKKIHLLEKVINEFASLECLSHVIICDIYYYLKEFLSQIEINRDFNEEQNVIIIEEIADKFIDNNVYKELFIEIKIRCLEKSQKYLSMLEYSKELFKLEPNSNIAANIITLSVQQGIKDTDYYAPYLKEVYDSNVPGHLMKCAFALKILGRINEADYYAYKALYFLDGSDDFNIYGELFRYWQQNYERRNNALTLKNADGNTVLTLLREDDTNNEKLIICLDSEVDLQNENSSMAVKHINRTNRLYSKLVSSSLNQILNIKGKRYKVCEIVPRDVFAFRFVIEKINKNPEQFKNFIWPITGKDVEDTIEQVKKILIKSKERNEFLLGLYNFKNNSIGIPIDWLIDGQYERYIAAVAYLLYTPDLAYYAGGETNEKKIENYYLLSISTLVILALNDWLDLINPIMKNIVCPESYIRFFQDLLDDERRKLAVSPGSLVSLDNGEIAILNHDENITAILERIIEKCNQFDIVPVTNDERINYDVIEGRLKGEVLITKSTTNVVQLDAFIVASKFDAKYICDDLFFRKLAMQKGIKNTNFASMLRVLMNLDSAVPIVLKLSKSNYTYLPFLYRNNEEAREILLNLTEGKRKKEIYSHLKEQFEYNDRFFQKVL